MLILSLCVQKKELWVGFYDHECCEFVSPFIPLFVLMTMVVVVNCVMIPILFCWGWGCCEWCDNSFHSCCGVVVNCVMIHSIVCCCVVDDNCCCGVVWWLIDPKCCGVVDVYCCELCDYDSFILRLLMVVCLAVVGEQTNQRVFLHNSQKEQPLFVSWRVQEQTFSLLKKRRNKLCLLKKCRNKLCCLLKNAEFCFVNIDISRGCQFVWLLAWSFDGWPAAAFSIR